MGTLNLKSLDVYECKALNGVYAKVYIRKRKCFMYIDDTRYEISELSKEESWTDQKVSENIETTNLDFSKDFTYSGLIYFNQNKEGWIFGIVNPSNRSNPLIVLRLEPNPTIN